MMAEGLRPYIDALDLSDMPRALEPHRALITDTILPTLLNRQAEAGRDICVGHAVEDVMAFQSANTDMPLFQPFDRKCQPSANEHDTLVIIAKRDDREIGCVASRNLWIETSLEDELRSMRLFYEDYRSQAPHGEICYVGRGVGANIKSANVIIGGALYVVPDERHDGLGPDLVKLQQLLELVTWRFTWRISLISDSHIGPGLHKNGSRDMQAPIVRLRPGERIEDRGYWLSQRHRESLTWGMMRPEFPEQNYRLNWPTTEDARALEAEMWGEVQ